MKKRGCGTLGRDTDKAAWREAASKSLRIAALPFFAS